MTAMKALVGILLITTFSACNKPQEKTKVETVDNIRVATIQLPTLKCKTCVAAVKRSLSGQDGIENTEINLEQKSAIVTFLPARMTIEKIELTISNAGYDANSVRRDSAAYESLPECCK